MDKEVLCTIDYVWCCACSAEVEAGSLSRLLDAGEYQWKLWVLIEFYLGSAEKFRRLTWAFSTFIACRPTKMAFLDEQDFALKH